MLESSSLIWVAAQRVGLSLNFPFYFVLDLSLSCDIQEPSGIGWAPETGGSKMRREDRREGNRAWAEAVRTAPGFKPHATLKGSLGKLPQYTRTLDTRASARLGCPCPKQPRSEPHCWRGRA